MKSSNGLSQQFGFWALLAAVIGLGILLFQIIQPFLIPLFFAAMLAMLCRPLFDLVVVWVNGRHRAAAAMTALILLLVLLPLGGSLFLAGRELADLGNQALGGKPQNYPLIRETTESLKSHLSPEDWQQLQDSVKTSIRGITSDIFQKTQALLSNVIRFVVGLAIMVLSLYYFFSEGPEILKTLRSVSPFEDHDEEVVLEKFASTCRGVILGSVVCAFVQALLLGMGLALAGVKSVWLLSGLTFLCSMIPFLGSGAVWGAVAIWHLATGEYGTALFIGLYGGAIVSTSDNLIRAYVLHESSNLHPLVALLSVIGAIQMVGMWGIFLGPLVAALFYTLLKLLNTRLGDDLEEESTEGRDSQSSDSRPGKTP